MDIIFGVFFFLVVFLVMLVKTHLHPQCFFINFVTYVFYMLSLYLLFLATKLCFCSLGKKTNYQGFAVKGIFRDPLIRSTLFSTHTDFIVYSERTLLY